MKNQISQKAGSSVLNNVHKQAAGLFLRQVRDQVTSVGTTAHTQLSNIQAFG